MGEVIPLRPEKHLTEEEPPRGVIALWVLQAVAVGFAFGLMLGLAGAYWIMVSTQ
jgi:hypothetical protein